MANFSTVKINHRELGVVSVKIDSEDKHLIVNRPTAICKAGGDRYYVRYSTEGREYLSRVILDKHNMLDYESKVRPNNGDHFDLRKKNWI